MIVRGGGRANVVDGPAVLQALSSETNRTVVLKIEEASLELLPSGSVVIPADSAGPVRIFLESSVDMINRVETSAGTYGTSTSNRFFRIRA